MSFDHAPYLMQLGDLHHGEAVKRCNCVLPIGQIPKNKLGDNKQVRRDIVPLQC
jgi:hypothetical protein